MLTFIILVAISLVNEQIQLLTITGHGTVKSSFLHHSCITRVSLHERGRQKMYAKHTWRDVGKCYLIGNLFMQQTDGWLKIKEVAKQNQK